MSHKVCIINTATNGLHTTYENVSKKNLYAIGRLIMLNYSIGHYDKKLNYIEEKNVYKILKPENITFNEDAVKIHKISYEKAQKEGINSKKIINDFKEDLKGVKIIISHSLDFHIKAIQAECFKTYESINFGKYILIDTMTFKNDDKYHKLIDLEKELNIKNCKDTIEKINRVFGKLYLNYKNSI